MVGTLGTVPEGYERGAAYLVIMILGLSLLLLLELVSNCFKVVPMLVLVGVRLALLDEIPGRLFRKIKGVKPDEVREWFREGSLEPTISPSLES